MNLFDKMNDIGFPTPPANARIKANGFQRYGKNKCYWVLYRTGVVIFGDHVTGESHTWFAKGQVPLTSAQLAERKAFLKQQYKLQKLEEARLHARVASDCVQRWAGLPDHGYSPYLSRKQVEGFGVRYDRNTVIVPIRDINNKLWSFHSIEFDSTKRFSTGGKKQGCFHTIGQIGKVVIVGEGYATLASIHMATGATCIVAFDAGNLEPVIEALAQKYPDLTITIAADDDRWKPTLGNIGRIKANEAAKRFGCAVALPWFKDIASKPTDWNDLHVLEGLDALQSQWMGVLYA